MTELFTALSGTWKKQPDDSIHGIIDASGTARAVAGKADDQNYEFLVTVEVNTGKVAILANHGVNASSEEEYVEMVLDPTGNTVKLDNVVMNSDGSEKSRTNLDTYNMTIVVGVEYRLRIKSVEYEATKFAVYGYINDFLVVQKEDLGVGFQTGLHGLESLGTADQYSEFSDHFFKDRAYYVPFAVLLNELRSVERTEIVGKDATMQNYYDKLAVYIQEASKFVDGECERPSGFFQSGGMQLTEYHDGIGATPPKGLYEFTESEEAYEERAGAIFTKQRPIISITTIKENKASIGETDNWQAITAYRHFEHGEIVFAPNVIPAKGRKNVEIIYQVGYRQTPLDIQLACVRLIVNLINKQISDRTASFQSFVRPTAINFAMPDICTSDIKAVFARYKLLGFGEM